MKQTQQFENIELTGDGALGLFTCQSLLPYFEAFNGAIYNSWGISCDCNRNLEAVYDALQLQKIVITA